MKTIGLTGSIGMGKTETAKLFSELGVPVFDSDAIVHQLMGIDGEATDAVEAAFGGVKKDGKIDRVVLGKKVLSDQTALTKLENILHPLVQEKRREFLQKQSSDLVLFDIPLLFEKNYEDQFDYIVVVSAPFEVQRQRVLSRANMTEQKFNDILEKQMPDQDKRAKADFVIQTAHGIDYARNQVIEILEKIRN